jgi:hypothetical protein
MCYNERMSAARKVCFFQARSNGSILVEYTNDPELKLKEIRRYRHGGVDLIGAIPGTRATADRIIERFRPFDGVEWLPSSSELLKIIETGRFESMDGEFGERLNLQSKIRFNCQMDFEIHERMKQKCDATGRSMSDVVRSLVVKWLDGGKDE